MSNTGSPSSDHDPMNCEKVWAELSAALDGERSVPLDALSEHLAACADCRNREDAAHRLTRSVRLTPAQAIPDQAPQIIGAVLAERAARRRGAPARRLARAGLAAAALAQSGIVVPALVLGQAGAGIPAHASHELGAFNLALAVGFAVAALRPARARGMLSLVGVATGTLVLLAVVDSASGETTLHAELPHVIVVVGCVLLFRLARTGEADPDAPPPPGHHRQRHRWPDRRRGPFAGAAGLFTGMAAPRTSLHTAGFVETSAAVNGPSSGAPAESGQTGDRGA